MYKLCVFAGTTEGRELVELLEGQPVAVTACVATEYGETLLTARENLTISAGRLSREEMEALLRREGFDLVVDATHPYAKEVTEHIAGACQTAGTDYLRLLREEQGLPEGAVWTPDAAGAAAYLSGRPGNILLTTGSKELGRFASIPGFAQRTYARVLPMEASLRACEAAGLSPAHILAMQGPFSREMNLAMLRAVSAAWLVTKEGGAAGGFQEKAEAAAEAGAGLVVIGRPPQRQGMDFAGAAEEIRRRFGLRWRPRVTLAGIGPGSGEAMTGQVRRAIREADCLIGARRMLEAAAWAQKPGQEAVSPRDIVRCIQERPDCRRFTVLLSGDTGFFSGAKRLLPALADCQVDVLPGLSSLQVLCARLRTSYEDVTCLSLHGREGDVVPDAGRFRRLFVLVGGGANASGLCGSLTRAGMGQVRVSVGERLGYPQERVTTGTAAELAGMDFDPLSAVLIENPQARPCAPGLPDELFQRGGEGPVVPMTKSEIRALVISRLRLREDSLCWDVGAGTGSVSIEIALQARHGRVYAVEKREDALELLRENRERFHLWNLELVPGAAPQVCRDLPAPTHAFIGGSSGGLREIVSLLLEKNPAVRIAAAAVTLESVAELTGIVRDFQFAEHEVLCLTSARGRVAGDYHLMAGQNPVYLFTMQKG